MTARNSALGDAFAEPEQTASAQEADSDYRTVTTLEQLQEMGRGTLHPSRVRVRHGNDRNGPDEERSGRAVFLEPNWHGMVRTGGPQRG